MPWLLSIFVGFWLLAICVAMYLAGPGFLQQFSPFALMGVIGAIFANSTGAGGGVVFVPLFNWLAFSEEQSVGTSFAIQSFGMTAGALTWLHYARSYQHSEEGWQPMGAIMAMVGGLAVLGASSVVWLDIPSPGTLKTEFSIFSIVLGGVLFYSAIFFKSADVRYLLEPIDWFSMVIIGLFGGVITAWLSVGVGELLALYLLLRRFDAVMAVASAVVVSALTVWASVPYHWLQGNVVWQVIVFAGPAAIVGGVFAKTVVAWMSPRHLKMFFSAWVLIMGVASFDFS